MKKKILAMSILLSVLLSACSTISTNEETPSETLSETNSNLGQTIEEKETKPEETIQEETIQEETIQEKTAYSIGETWIVDGQWNFTINAITETDYRNEYWEKDSAQVFMIDYTYENIGYDDTSGIMDGLYFDISMEQIIDSEGYMGYSYPGDIVNYPQEVPIGAKCEAQACIGVDNKSTEIKITITNYDGNSKKQTATFILPVE